MKFEPITSWILLKSFTAQQNQVKQNYMRMRDWTAELQPLHTITEEIQLNLIADLVQCRGKLNIFSVWEGFCNF
jgi:hypothetical protein